jgi:arginase
MNEWTIIGVPTSAGAHYAGQELAPDALRAAGLPDALRAIGLAVTDDGNLPAAVFEPDRDSVSGRNLPAVARVARQVADRVAEVANAGRRPLVLGGDCTITVGAVAGLKRAHSDVGLLYVDGDADLGVPGDGGSGIFDSMGIAHLLGRGAPELAGLAGAPPLLRPANLAILGSDPRETTGAEREDLAGLGVSFTEAPAFTADPAGAAQRALAAVAGVSGPLLVHFDVDVVDSADLPLGNFPHYGSGVRLEHAVRALRVLCAHPRLAGLVVTEINPTHEPAGKEIARLTDALAAVLAPAA